MLIFDDFHAKKGKKHHIWTNFEVFQNRRNSLVYNKKIFLGSLF